VLKIGQNERQITIKSAFIRLNKRQPAKERSRTARKSGSQTVNKHV